ncbi:hypothetical protein V8D89_015074 [Ganoderma adspersum]
MNPSRFQPPTGGHSRGARSTNPMASGQANYGGGVGIPVASTQGRHGTVTPISGLTFRVGELVWLKHYVNDAFPGGHIVEIASYEQQLPSPTARSNQSAEWQKSDYDTVYRFKRPYVTHKVGSLLSRDRLEPPRHDQLTLVRGGEPAPRQYSETDLVYLREELYFKVDEGNTSSPYIVRVPKGTLCAIRSHTSRSGGPQYGKKMTNFQKCCYVLKAKYLQEQVSEVVSSHKKEFHNFRAATREEIADYQRKLNPRGGAVVVNWNEA